MALNFTRNRKRRGDAYRTEKPGGLSGVKAGALAQERSPVVTRERQHAADRVAGIVTQGETSRTRPGTSVGGLTDKQYRDWKNRPNPGSRY